MSFNLQQLIRDACAQSKDSDKATLFHNDYSGRSMYGKNCIAISGSHTACQATWAEVIRAASQEVVEAALDGTEEDAMMLHSSFTGLVHAICKHKTDSFGYDIIMYWPDLPPLEDDEEQEG